MSEAHADTRACDATRESGNDAATGAADWLYLAAAPTFAIMALLTGLLGGGSADALCSVANASPLTGMVPMYVLMGAFHSPPWLRLITNWRQGASRPDPAFPHSTQPRAIFSKRLISRLRLRRDSRWIQNRPFS
jgi:hypothetical protein